MRKRKRLPQKNTVSPSRATLTLYVIGMLILAVPLFYTVFVLSTQGTLSIPQVKYYANVLEHIIAGLTLLTAGCYLVERVAREQRK